jgi:hypothetical protein
MSNTIQIGIFLLVVWFFHTFSPYMSLYTVPIVIDLLKVISSYSLPKGPFAIFSIVVANIDQFLTFFICGSILRGLIPDVRRARLFAILLYSIFTALYMTPVIGNYDSTYGMLARFIVVILNCLFISAGFVIIGCFHKSGGKVDHS